MIIATADRVRRLDTRRAVEYQAASAYAEQAAARAARVVCPIDAALLAAVANGASKRAAALAVGIPVRTANGRIRKAMR